MGIRYVIAIVVFALQACGTSATAQTITHQQAADKVVADQVALEDLYEHVPRLRQIGDVVRKDCGARNSGKTADSWFCSCAAAVTMRLWRSGVDPNMSTHLQSFVSDPAASPDKFTAFEGPELYRPLCHLAEPRSAAEEPPSLFNSVPAVPR